MIDFKDLTTQSLVFLIEHERLHEEHGGKQDHLFVMRAKEELDRRAAEATDLTINQMQT